MTDKNKIPHSFQGHRFKVSCVRCLNELINQQIKKALINQKSQFAQIVKNANIHVSDLIINQNCENCSHNIEAHINHFVDCFYKELIEDLMQMEKEL